MIIHVAEEPEQIQSMRPPRPGRNRIEIQACPPLRPRDWTFSLDFWQGGRSARGVVTYVARRMTRHVCAQAVGPARPEEEQPPPPLSLGGKHERVAGREPWDHQGAAARRPATVRLRAWTVACERRVRTPPLTPTTRAARPLPCRVIPSRVAAARRHRPVAVAVAQPHHVSYE